VLNVDIRGLPADLFGGDATRALFRLGDRFPGQCRADSVPDGSERVVADPAKLRT